MGVAQERQRLTPDRLVYDVRLATEPRVSPDGRLILYTLRQVDRATHKGTSQIWMCRINGADARQLTRIGTHTGGGRWSPDGRWVAFVSDRGNGRGIYVLPADGPGEAREVTRHNVGISGLAWSPDGSRIAYNAAFDPENPNETEPEEGAAPKVRVTRRIDYKLDGPGWLGDTREHIFVVDVSSGERLRLTTASEDHSSPVWSPNGATVATSVADWTRGTTRLLLIDIATGDQRELGASDGVVSDIAWSPSGESILFAGEERWTPQPDFFVLNVAK